MLPRFLNGLEELGLEGHREVAVATFNAPRSADATFDEHVRLSFLSCFVGSRRAPSPLLILLYFVLLCPPLSSFVLLCSPVALVDSSCAASLG